MENKITLSELTNLLVETQEEFTATEAEEFLKALFDLIFETLINGEQLKIKDLGTFKLTRVKARESVDVNTGNKIEIPEHSRVTFSPATALRELVNKPFSHFESVLLNEGVTFDEIPSFEPDENEQDDDIQEQIPEKEAAPKSTVDKIAETIQMAADELETDSDSDSIEKSEIKEEPPVTASQIESLQKSDNEILATERSKEQIEKKDSRRSAIWIPLLGGIAIAAASFFFSSTNTKFREK